MILDIRAMNGIDKTILSVALRAINAVDKPMLSAALSGIVAGTLFCFAGQELPIRATTETIRTLGHLSAVTGLIVGLSASWITANKSLLKDFDPHRDNRRAEELFLKLGKIEKEIIWKWAIVYLCCMAAVFFANLALGTVVNEESHLPISHSPRPLLFAFASALLMMAFYLILNLFIKMMELSTSKTELENHAYELLRRNKHVPNIKD